MRVSIAPSSHEPSCSIRRARASAPFSRDLPVNDVLDPRARRHRARNRRHSDGDGRVEDLMAWIANATAAPLRRGRLRRELAAGAARCGYSGRGVARIRIVLQGRIRYERARHRSGLTASYDLVDAGAQSRSISDTAGTNRKWNRGFEIDGDFRAEFVYVAEPEVLRSIVTVQAEQASENPPGVVTEAEDRAIGELADSRGRRSVPDRSSRPAPAFAVNECADVAIGGEDVFEAYPDDGRTACCGFSAPRGRYPRRSGSTVRVVLARFGGFVSKPLLAQVN